MATVSVVELVGVFNFAVGDTDEWWWNNAPSEAVWAFSVDSIIPTLTLVPSAVARVQVDHVEYRQRVTNNALEREVHVYVKNTGTILANYVLHMARIQK